MGCFNLARRTASSSTSPRRRSGRARRRWPNRPTSPGPPEGTPASFSTSVFPRRRSTSRIRSEHWPTSKIRGPATSNTTRSSTIRRTSTESPIRFFPWASRSTSSKCCGTRSSPGSRAFSAVTSDRFAGRSPEPIMIAFFLSRGLWLAAVVAIMFVISLVQGGISYTMAFGPLSGLLPRDRSAIATVLVVMRFGLVALMATLWALGRKHALFQLVILANALFTLALLVHTSGLIAVLFGGASEAVNALLVDVVLMAASNILIFSVWYWIIDPPGVGEVPRSDEPWEFLFPQR